MYMCLSMMEKDENVLCADELKQKDISKNTLLHLCAYNPKLSDAASTLVHHVDVRDRNAHGMTCCHIAAASKNPRFLQIVLKYAKQKWTEGELFKYLSTRDWNGRMYTALHFATSVGCEESIKVLLQVSGHHYGWFCLTLQFFTVWRSDKPFGFWRNKRICHSCK